MAPASEKKDIVVIGGGIIGCSTAYFLTRHPSYDPQKHTITLLEASQIAGGASGKAGGLLALWAYPSNIVPLSYRLHAELAKEHNGAERWGYRRIHCGHVDAKGRPPPKAQSNGSANDNGDADVSLEKLSDSAAASLRAKGVPADLDWLAPECVHGYDEMGTPETTAQVHPLQFTQSMAALAAEAGVKVITDARVTAINPDKKADTKDAALESITYQHAGASKTLRATDAVLAAGPWTGRLLPSAPIAGLRAHSVTIRPARPVSAYALFTAIALPAGPGGGRARQAAPEMYARPNNEVYACGEGDRLVALPETTADVEVDAARCDEIVAHVGAVSDVLRRGAVTARQACYLPVSERAGGPYIGPCREMRGLVLAAGHTCWGIQNGPGTGKLVSELVFDGTASSAKLGSLEPLRSMY